MSKKGLFEQIADAISSSRWARKDLENLDDRAFKMQGDAKTWGKNSDKMNARANALQSKAMYNEYLADKLRSDALDKVNEGNRAWNYKLNDWKDKQRVYNAVSEANWNANEGDGAYGRMFGDRNVYTKCDFSEPDRVEWAGNKLGYDKPIDNAEKALEDMATNYYPKDYMDIEKMNIRNSDGMRYIEDGMYPTDSYWENANAGLDQFVNDNKLNTYSNNFKPQEKWKAMYFLQQAPARYRK